MSIAMTTEEDAASSDQYEDVKAMVPVESQSERSVISNLWSDAIPEELFLNILHVGVRKHGTLPFLCRVARVCRRWCDLSYHPSLWLSVDLSIGWIVRDTRGLQLLCESRLQKTNHINLTSWFGFNDESLECVLENCHQLRSLNLSHCEKLTPRGIEHLCTTSVPLTEVTLSFMSPQVSSHDCLSRLINAIGPRLRKLVLSHNMVDNEFSEVLSEISDTCRSLEHLDISHLVDTFLTVPAVYLDVERLQHGCPHLRVLLMNKSKIKLRPVPEETQAFSPGFPELRRFSGPLCVTDNFLERTLKSSFELESLKVSIDLARDLHYSRIPAVALRKLVVHKARPSQLQVKWHESLEVLDFSWMKLAGTWNVRGLLEREFERVFNSSGQRFAALHTVILCGTPITVNCIRHVFDSCPHLYTLNLCMCGLLPSGWAKEFSGTELTFFKHVMVGIELPGPEMGS